MTDDQHGGATPPSDGRWNPLPPGDYDDGATAFVKLPEGGIDALLAGDSPLAAPGHGYVPPRITATPGATGHQPPGAWGMPADGQEWPDPNAVPQEQVTDDRFTYQPGLTQHWTYEEPSAPPAPGHDVTGHWSIPVAGGDLPDESGEFTTSALVEQWGGTPPATLPGGAPAPWATEGAGQPWAHPETTPHQPGPTEPGLPSGYPGDAQAQGGPAGYQDDPAGYDEAGASGVAGHAGPSGYAGGVSGPTGHVQSQDDPAGYQDDPAGYQDDLSGYPGDVSRVSGHAPAHGDPAGYDEAGASGVAGHAGPSGSGYADGMSGAPGHAQTHGDPAGYQEDPSGSAGHADPSGYPGDASGATGTHPAEGFALPGAYAPSHGDGFSVPQHPLAHSGHVPHEPEDPAGHDVRQPDPAEGATDGGHGPAQAPEGPADGPADHTGTAGARPAPTAGETPATPDAEDAADPFGAADGMVEVGAALTDDASGAAAATGATTDSTDPSAPADAAEATDVTGTPDDPATAHAAPGTEPSADADAEAADASAADTVAPDPDDPAGHPAHEPAPLAPNDDHPLASYVLRVNGADRPVTDAWIGESLLYVLRERLGLAGAKDGCSQGECGACNVQVDGRLVASCLVPAVTSAGSEVRTVEGLAVDGQPSDVQRALARCGAVQCGFCVPGMAMTVHDLLEGNPAPTELETRQALCGNLCRCSGYRGVLEAVKEVVAEREAQGAADDGTDTDDARIPHQAGPGAGGVNPSAFDVPGVFDSPGTFGTPAPHDPHYGQDGGQA